MSGQARQQPSPELFFQTIYAYQRTEALRAAIELEIFSVIAEGKATVADIARHCDAAERGVRILCDYLCIMGFLGKNGVSYTLTPDSAFFLDKRSPTYLGSMMEFILSPELAAGFKDLTAAVKKGGTVVPDEGMVGPENPIWVKFARTMGVMMSMPALMIAQMVDKKANQKIKILDVAAGHGLFGITFARRNRQAEVVAVDWPNVLEVAKENAARAGVSNRYRTLPGSAFDVDYGTGYDVVLLTNFLHHFDPSTCETILRKVHAALVDGGRAATLEFVPNDDRISPPEAAGFSLMMLGSTPGGDAYTFSELERMAANAGFSRSELFPLPPTAEHVMISEK